MNDINEGIVSKINKFADDCKLGKSVRSQEDVEVLRKDLGRLGEWAERWQMKFNIEKCSVLHIGRNNAEHKYELNHNLLKANNAKRDLGVMVDSKIKFAEHCNSVVHSANATLGMIKRTITSRNKDSMVRLYKALVRPKLEYCVQVWRPFLKKDIEKLESVQHRATKMMCL